MSSILLTIILHCAQTELINQTKDPWSQFDKQILAQAKKRCGELYSDAPCLKKLYKRPEQSYWAICSKEIK